MIHLSVSFSFHLLGIKFSKLSTTSQQQEYNIVMKVLIIQKSYFIENVDLRFIIF